MSLHECCGCGRATTLPSRRSVVTALACAAIATPFLAAVQILDVLVTEAFLPSVQLLRYAIWRLTRRSGARFCVSSISRPCKSMRSQSRMEIRTAVTAFAAIMGAASPRTFARALVLLLHRCRFRRALPHRIRRSRALLPHRLDRTSLRPTHSQFPASPPTTCPLVSAPSRSLEIVKVPSAVAHLPSGAAAPGSLFGHAVLPSPPHQGFV